jgi:DNA-binding MarR family transcriptional regulator
MESLDVMGLLRAAQILERNVTVALLYAGLRVPQFRLLQAIAESDQATVTDVSKKLNITRATASVMVNDLIRMQVIATVENPSDRRSFHVRLTERGQNKLLVAKKDIHALTQGLSSRFPQEIINALNEFVRMAGH